MALLLWMNIFDIYEKTEGKIVDSVDIGVFMRPVKLIRKLGPCRGV